MFHVLSWQFIFNMDQGLRVLGIMISIYSFGLGISVKSNKKVLALLMK